MAAVNITGRNYRVWICNPYLNETDDSNGFEVTKYCSGESGGYLTMTNDPPDESGILRTSGRLVLDVPPIATFHPWKNPNRWAKGNFVYVLVADEAGTLRPPPLNVLFFLANAAPPNPGTTQMEIELGDVLTLRDSERPPRVPEGTGVVNRTVIAKNLAAKTNVEIRGSLPGASFQGYQPDPDRPIVEQLGEIAMGGSSTLFQWRDGTVRTIRFNFAPVQRLFKHVIGVDDAGNPEYLQSPIRAANEVEVVSDESDSADPNAGNNGGNDDEDEDEQRSGGCNTTREFYSLSSIDEENLSEEQILAVVRKECWDWGGATLTETVEEIRCRGLVVPEDLYLYLIQQGRNISYPGPFQIINALYSIQRKQYEGGDEGRLLSVRREVYKPLGEVLAEFYKKNLLPNASTPDFYFMVLAELEIWDYEYKRFDFGKQSGKDSQGQVRKINYRHYLLKGQVAAAANDWIQTGGLNPTLAFGSTDLFLYEQKIERWRRRDSQTWEYKIRHVQAGRARSGTRKAFLIKRSVPGQNYTKVSRDGEIRPPAAERRQADDSKSRRALKEPIRGSVSFEGDPREKVVNLKHIDSEQAAKRIAEIIGVLGRCRERGLRIVSRFRDEWFWWKPLSRIDVEFPQEEALYMMVTDSITFTFAANQAIVVADLMSTAELLEGDAV